MKCKKGFACTYFKSAAMEGSQPAEIQSCLYRLWAAHHDDYAPDFLKIEKTSFGSKRTIVMLVEELRARSVAAAQKELNRLHFG